jgi:hypothetical protein
MWEPSYSSPFRATRARGAAETRRTFILLTRTSHCFDTEAVNNTQGHLQQVDERAKLAYEAEVRSLDMQVSSLDALRSRAGTLFAVTSLVATFLGSQTLKAKGLHSWPIWVAVAALVGSCLLTLLVLWPWHWWQARIDGKWVLENWVDQKSYSINVLYRRLAISASGKYDANHDSIVRLERIYQAAGLLVLVQIIAWLIALRGLGCQKMTHFTESIAAA